MENDTFGSIPYIPGRLPDKTEPLAHYIPPVYHDVISTWLQKNIPPGSWVLDPFCASPRVAIEAARAGYKVLVAANNPIARFVLEMMANPPRSEDLQSSLAVLASSYIGTERVEPHIQALYSTLCSKCGQVISADAFLWEHGNPSPYMRSYSCPNCGYNGEYPCTPYDVELAGRFVTSGLHKARALERVVATNDQDRIHVEQALAVYIPRALYALITIINKMEGLNLPETEKKYLTALLLHAFDRATALWKDPEQRERRRSLNMPRVYREKNIWCALEEGINLWCDGGNTNPGRVISLSIWPELPTTAGGICIYEGRFSTLAGSLKEIDIRAVCSALPRPNQAFWTLSALWAGWLWGRESVGAFKSVLHRQRYDWGWHTSALASVFKNLASSLDPSTRILGLIGETEPSFIGSSLVAAGIGGCQLESIALRPEENQAQIHWTCANNPELAQITSSQTQAAIHAAKSYLEIRAEPASYLSTITSALIGITRSWGMVTPSRGQKDQISTQSLSTDSVEQNEPTPSLIYSSIYNCAREALAYRSGFLRYKSQELTNPDSTSKSQNLQSSLFSLDLVNISVEDDASEEKEMLSLEPEATSERERPTRSSDISGSTMLWLRDTENVSQVPITDSYEISLANYLVTHPGCTAQDIDRVMCSLFPGLITPDIDFIHLCLESYAIRDPDHPAQWSVRHEDDLAERQADLQRASYFIHQIGNRLGFNYCERSQAAPNRFLVWQDPSINEEYWFYPTISAAIAEIVIYGEQPPTRGYIVVPGSRANLLFYKLSRDPRLSKAFNPTQGDWRFLKFRHLWSLAESIVLNRENMEQILGLDPITYSAPQLWLI